MILSLYAYMNTWAPAFFSPRLGRRFLCVFLYSREHVLRTTILGQRSLSVTTALPFSSENKTDIETPVSLKCIQRRQVRDHLDAGFIS
ncbi:uncharacterized protein BT62DRAFT_571043 [Guyanagaster necrorhizus]|uniref:Uncharacterized protein n=1 Tax=Guyanagaster necrorhizus TaxID=856835 RepID=A0A9P8AMC6_9AGAR|nr:uncharacterized protein BT62DRAFT_571043 [Guyanagaster necrorhizus MCA 3950]KAG7440750.1 hypothetical protein BT62DRAFT_571043 [Guyanagaster necrorhizus MCA 3950]